jgi:serine/threonine-protein kinase
MPPQNRSKVPIGTVLEGKFRITQEIGRGGMAAVYEAENVDIGKRVAVKILADELLSSHVVRERFIREARAAAAIRSPFICEVYDVGMYEDRPFLIMELLEGESLYDRMTRVRQMPVDTTVKVAAQVGRGLRKAHEAGIVHRDLKPENIFLTRDEDGELLAKIVDFGLAKFYEGAGDEKNVRLTREGALFGTPAYMSPEQAKGQGEVDHRADLWALGCIVYECLTGQTVWNVEQGVAMILAQIAGAPLPVPSRLRPELPVAFDEWFQRALDRDPTRRFQTAQSLTEGLIRSLGPEAQSARAPLASELEGSIVDALVEGRPIPVAPGADAKPPSSRLPGGLVGQVSPDPQSVEPPSFPPPRGGAGRAILWLGLASVLALGGYALWLYVLHPPGGLESATRAATGEGAEPLRRQPAENAPYAVAINEAQELLGDGKHEAAIGKLKSALDMEGGKIVGQSLLAHTEAAFEGPAQACRLAGMGRPRPFEVMDPASYPALVLSSAGPLVAWTDAHQDARRRHAYVALLDGVMRRVSPALNITPESTSAVSPALQPAQDGLALVYWESGGKEPGVYVRKLETDGRIASPSRLLSEPRKDKYHPTLARLEDGGFLALWSERKHKANVSDIVVRRLDAKLEPVGDTAALTAFLKGGASYTAATVVGDKLYVALRYSGGGAQGHVQLLRVPLNAPELSTGVKPQPKKDVVAGELVDVHGPGPHSEPSLVCGSDGCLLVWDEEGAGALAAFVPHDKQEPLWHREFAPEAIRPTVVPVPAGDGQVGEARGMVAYFAGSRLRLAPIHRDGVGPSSVISRVSGFQPRPALAPGEQPGEWLMAWRDYEAGHLEVFVAKASCGEAPRR